MININNFVFHKYYIEVNYNIYDVEATKWIKFINMKMMFIADGMNKTFFRLFFL